MGSRGTARTNFGRRVLVRLMWRKSRVKPASLHPANARALLAGVVGVFVGLGVAWLVRLALEWFNWLSTAGTEPVFAGSVTAGVAGGAAGLTYTNLLYKRAESLRGERAMHQETLRVASELVDSHEELKAISGANLLAGLIEMSPVHAQTAADILCARLRRKPDPWIDGDQLERSNDEDLSAWRSDRRVRNAICDAIARTLARDLATAHVRSVRWDFEGAFFGDRSELAGAVFGAGTRFVDAIFSGNTSFTQAEFIGGCNFESVSAPDGMRMGGVRSDGALRFFDSTIGWKSETSGWGLYLEGAEVAGLEFRGVRADQGLHLDAAAIEGDVRVFDCTAKYFSLIDARRDPPIRSIVVENLTVADYICVKRSPVRNGVKIKGCEAGAEIEVTGTGDADAVHVVDSSCSTVKLGEAEQNELWARHG